MYGKLG
ncbi:uncharacterized protein FFMR_14104 [Fusarium fujikuroi]|nr:uncharacterized protein FFMR_14104 [Fusarium fujikuroi]